MTDPTLADWSHWTRAPWHTIQTCAICAKVAAAIREAQARQPGFDAYLAAKRRAVRT
mgnify:FL=1